MRLFIFTIYELNGTTEYIHNIEVLAKNREEAEKYAEECVRNWYGNAEYAGDGWYAVEDETTISWRLHSVTSFDSSLVPVVKDGKEIGQLLVSRII